MLSYSKQKRDIISYFLIAFLLLAVFFVHSLTWLIVIAAVLVVASLSSSFIYYKSLTNDADRNKYIWSKFALFAVVIVASILYLYFQH